MTEQHNGVSESPSHDDNQRARQGPRAVITVLIAEVIIAAGAVGLWFIFTTEPEATREGATRESAMLVEVTEVAPGRHRPTFAAAGTVRASREVVLRPRVEGQVTEHAASLQPGGLVEAGSTLVTLDPADYRQTLRQRRSALQQAQAALEREQGQQRVAAREYEIADKQLEGESKALALRRPQLQSAKAEVDAARAAVTQARLDLERTTIEAPFDAQVLERQVDVGSQVSVGDALARLVGVETYWVEVTVPVSKLSWLAFPDSDAEGAPVTVHNNGAWADGRHRQGRLFRLVGNLDDATRMARVLVAVDDPLARRVADQPRLILGTFVEARMEGRAVADVVRLDRDYLRSNDTVWVMVDGELDIREVDVAVRDSEHAYIRDGLDDGDRVVTSSLATIREGAPLRVDDGGPGGNGADGS
jgi:RND family efflux transporter MFP subunit